MLKNLTLLFSLLLCAFTAGAQTAQLQLIHNSPTPGTSGGPAVDVYANGNLLVGDVAYRTATGYVDVPAGMMIEVAVALAGSTSVDDAIFTTTIGPLTADEDHVAYANGAVGDTDQPFAIVASDQAEQFTTGAGLVDILAFHGALDAPAVDIKAGLLTIVDDLAYANFADPDPVAATAYVLTVTSADESVTVGNYNVDVTNFGGEGLNVFASGVLGGSPAFGLFAATNSGEVVELPEVAIATAALQIIHNSPTPGTTGGPAVDVYVNGAALLEDFEYLSATPYLPVPSGLALDVAVALAGSNSADDAFFTTTLGPLDADVDYVAYAAGIAGDDDEPFTLFVSDEATQTSGASNTLDLLIHHGAVNAFPVDVFSGGSLAMLDYSEFASLPDLPPGNYLLQIFNTLDDSFVEQFIILAAETGGLGVNLWASGSGEGEPPFGLHLALPNGEVVRLSVPSSLQIVHASPTPGQPDGPLVDIYVNGQLNFDDVPYLAASALSAFDNPGLDTFNIAIAPADAGGIEGPPS